tara:strand:- start:1617 stop:1880 length:264 start_codon:yes stop_codon:yes gene_type:complete
MISVRLFLKLPNVLELQRGMFLPSVSNRVRSGNGGKVIEPKIDNLLDQLFRAKQKQAVLDVLYEELHLRQLAAEFRIQAALEKARDQ